MADPGRPDAHAAPQFAEAEQALAAIQAQAAAARAELQLLRGELAQVRLSLAASREAHLVEANERLVLAALQAIESADTVRGDLDAMTHASQTDSLTGLPNRALMLDRLETALAMATRRGTQLAVLFVDLDGFKHVNDSFGHARGDAVLCSVARCLSACLRQSDTVSRHGGDEFLLLLTEITSATDAAAVAAMILSELGQPGRFIDASIRLGASVGIALYPADGTRAETLIEHADAAMYQAKKRGGGCYEFRSQPVPAPTPPTPAKPDGQGSVLPNATWSNQTPNKR